MPRRWGGVWAYAQPGKIKLVDGDKLGSRSGRMRELFRRSLYLAVRHSALDAGVT